MKSLSNAEWEVMRVIWSKQEVTSNEIIDVLATNMNWKPSTIKTLLIRLGEKKYIQAQKQGRKFLYTAVVNETEALQQKTTQPVHCTCIKGQCNCHHEGGVEHETTICHS